MARGRPPLPTALHEQRGTYSVNPERRRRREPKIGGRPTKPASIKGVAAKEWKRIVGLLDSMGVLSRAEAPAIEQYCRAYAEWAECCRIIDEEGIVVEEDRGKYTVWKRNPADAIRQALAVLIAKYLSEFGLTPSSRARLQTPEQDGSDVLLSMLNARNTN